MRAHDISDIAVTDEEVRRVNEWAREVHIKPALRRQERIMNTPPIASDICQALDRWGIDPTNDDHIKVWMRFNNPDKVKSQLSIANTIEGLDYTPAEIRRDAKLIWRWIENGGEIAPDEFNP